VRSLRNDLNQLILALPEDPTIIVDGQVVDEHFDWNVFHNVPGKTDDQKTSVLPD